MERAGGRREERTICQRYCSAAGRNVGRSEADLVECGTRARVGWSGEGMGERDGEVERRGKREEEVGSR